MSPAAMSNRAPCPCTLEEQDETCPIGYPSLLCEICDGKGLLPPATDDPSAKLAEWGDLAKVIDEILSYDVLSGRTGDALKAAREAIPTLIKMVREKDVDIDDLKAKATALGDTALNLEARATAAEARVKGLEAENIEREAELIYLRMYGKDGAVWHANHSKDVWREKARAALRRQS